MAAPRAGVATPASDILPGTKKHATAERFEDCRRRDVAVSGVGKGHDGECELALLELFCDGGGVVGEDGVVLAYEYE